jgi:hypothetical protein
VGEKRITNDLDNDYRLVGIATALKEYKLCYHLNLLLNCDFRKLKDLVFAPKDRSRGTIFSVFKAGDDMAKNQFIVFANKNLGEYLLHEVSNFDYVIQVLGKYEDQEMAGLIEAVRAFPEVMMVTEIPLKRIRSKERLVYEEEKPARKLFHPKPFK